VLAPADAERLARALPAGRVATIPDAGHTVQGDNPAELARVLRGFVSALV
jgi:pimeloyl-ACP methyl ester carboxylesterase